MKDIIIDSATINTSSDFIFRMSTVNALSLNWTNIMVHFGSGQYIYIEVFNDAGDDSAAKSLYETLKESFRAINSDTK